MTCGQVPHRTHECDGASAVRRGDAAGRSRHLPGDGAAGGIVARELIREVGSAGTGCAVVPGGGLKGLVEGEIQRERIPKPVGDLQHRVNAQGYVLDDGIASVGSAGAGAGQDGPDEVACRRGNAEARSPRIIGK